MTATVINSIIALTLSAFAMKHRENTIYLIFLLFVYISLHYSYAIIAIIGTPKYIMLCRSLRAAPQIGVKAIGFGFLLVVGVLMVKPKKDRILTALRQQPFQGMAVFTALWIFCVGGYWAFAVHKQGLPSFLAIQDVFSSIVSLLLAVVIGIAIPDKKPTNGLSMAKLLWMLMVLVIVMNVFAFLQLVTGKTFAGNYNLDGNYAARACALLFNPNVLGLWCTCIAGFAAYAFHARRDTMLPVTWLVMIFLSLGILMSGSRSALLVCMAMLLAVSFLQYMHLKRIYPSFFPLISFLISFGCIGLLIKIINLFSSSAIKLVNTLSALVDRFANMPEEIILYGVYKLNGYLIKLSRFLEAYTGYSVFSEYSRYLGSIGKKPVPIIHQYQHRWSVKSGTLNSRQWFSCHVSRCRMAWINSLDDVVVIFSICGDEMFSIQTWNQ